MIGEGFPEIKDGITVHSRLRSEDLRLIREAFVAYAEGKGSRYDVFTMKVSDVAKMRELLKRMLRKVK